MVAPIWYSIELNAVGELHGGLLGAELSPRLLGTAMVRGVLDVLVTCDAGMQRLEFDVTRPYVRRRMHDHAGWRYLGDCISRWGGNVLR